MMISAVSIIYQIEVIPKIMKIMSKRKTKECHHSKLLGNVLTVESIEDANISKFEAYYCSKILKYLINKQFKRQILITKYFSNENNV